METEKCTFFCFYLKWTNKNELSGYVDATIFPAPLARLVEVLRTGVISVLMNQ